MKPVGLAELRMEVLLGAGERIPVLKPLSPYPSVARDVALIVAEHVTHGEIVSTIRRHAPVELTGIQLFDIFRGEGIGVGRKSLAYSLTYRSLETMRWRG